MRYGTLVVPTATTQSVRGRRLQPRRGGRALRIRLRWAAIAPPAPHRDTHALLLVLTHTLPLVLILILASLVLRLRLCVLLLLRLRLRLRLSLSLRFPPAPLGITAYNSIVWRVINFGRGVMCERNQQWAAARWRAGGTLHRATPPSRRGWATMAPTATSPTGPASHTTYAARSAPSRNRARARVLHGTA